MKLGKEITLENVLNDIRNNCYKDNNLGYVVDGKFTYIDILKKEYVNIFGIELELNMNHIFEIVHGRWASTETKEKFIEKYKEIFEKQLNIDEIKKTVEYKKEKNKKRNKTIQKLYDELYIVYSSLGYKADIKKLEELNDLLYCEVKIFLDDIEGKIFKKKTAKAIRCYKKLMEIRGKSNEIIECN